MSHVVSRRIFLTASAAAAMSIRHAYSQAVQKTWMFVGCYTTRGQGIYVYEVNPANGALSPVRVVPAGVRPSFLAISPNGRNLYACNEIANYQARQSGSVTSFSINAESGDLTQINVQPSEGRNPAHVSVDPTGKFVFAANYTGSATGGNVSVLPIEADGSLGAPAHVVQHAGTLGPISSRQELPHAHQILPDPTGRWVLSNDLGLDRTFVYFLDRGEGTLTANSNAIVAPSGGGPRHLAFHPNGRFLYILNELASVITVSTWDPESGAATAVQTISTLPEWYRGISTTAQIIVSPDGRFVYASNRGHDSIAVFAVDSATGQLTFVERYWTFGETPRNFNIDPTGNFLFVANQATDNITTFRIDKATGMLTFTGAQLVTPGEPSCIVFHAASMFISSTQPGVTFGPTQNPTVAGPSGLGQVTVAWNAPSVSEVEIRLGGPNGVFMGRFPNYGTATTGPWVGNGLMFYLQDGATTLGSFTAQVRA